MASTSDGAMGWELCLSGEECTVVYYRGDRAVLLKDVRAVPFHKATGSNRTVCFCFGHSERDLVSAGGSGGSAIRQSIAESCRQGKSDCERANPAGRCCLRDVDRVLKGSGQTSGGSHACCQESPTGSGPESSPGLEAKNGLTTLATLRSWAATHERFNVFTCYDATTARWLAKGGARVLLVGDSAAQWMLGLDRSGKASLEYMATIGAAVKRGAPHAFVIVDYPDDLVASLKEHADRICRLAEESGASAVKVEGAVDVLRELLRERPLQSVPVVAHLRYEAAGERCVGDSDPTPGPAPAFSASLAADLLSVAEAGAIAVLLQGLGSGAATAAIQKVATTRPELLVLGCHAGSACVGEIEMLYGLLGLGSTSPSSAGLGDAISDVARRRIAALRRPAGF